MKLCCDLPTFRDVPLVSRANMLFVFCFGLEYIFGNVIFVNRANIISRRIKQASN